MANLILPPWMIDAIKDVPADNPVQIPMPDYPPPREPEPIRDWED